MFFKLNVLFIGILGFFTMTAKIFLTTSLVLHLCTFTSYTYAFMRLNVRATATAHPVVAITNSFVKFESCPSSGPLNASCNVKYAAVEATFGPPPVKDLVGHYQAVTPRNACEEISPIHATARQSATPFIAIVSRGNCSFDVKVYNAEKAGYRAVIIYAYKDDKQLLNMSSSNPSIRVTIPSFYVSHATGTMLAYSSKMANGTRPSTLLIATRKKTFLSSPPNFTGKLGVMDANTGEEEDGDNFGEHYFHICIYIWACVVVSSLIGLSVKWGCCGRSLTRWEVTKIPLKRFRRDSGCEYQDKCPICHEEFHEGRLIRQLPCNHCYHSYCVDRWLVKMSNRCPLCKQRVSVSLFCSWNKQRDSEVLQQSDADLDAEASVGELPPLPPVQTLTPNSLYGDIIMSGPSKFILMRPGKATRVIEVPKKENDPKNNTAEGGIATDKNTCAKSSPSVKRGQYDRQIATSLSSPSSISRKMMYEENLKEDVICMETLHHHSSIKTSRSSSITSEHPLLLDEDRLSLQSSSDCVLIEGSGDGSHKRDRKFALDLDSNNSKKKKKRPSSSASCGNAAHKKSQRRGSNSKRRSSSSGVRSVEGGMVSPCNHNVAVEVNVSFSKFFHVDVERCGGSTSTVQPELHPGEDNCESVVDKSSRKNSALDLYGDADTCSGDSSRSGGSSNGSGGGSSNGSGDSKYDVAACTADSSNSCGIGSDGVVSDSGVYDKCLFNSNSRNPEVDASVSENSRRNPNRISYPPSLLHHVAWDDSLRRKESKSCCHTGKNVSSL